MHLEAESTLIVLIIQHRKTGVFVTMLLMVDHIFLSIVQIISFRILHSVMISLGSCMLKGSFMKEAEHG